MVKRPVRAASVTLAALMLASCAFSSGSSGPPELEACLSDQAVTTRYSGLIHSHARVLVGGLASDNTVNCYMGESSSLVEFSPPWKRCVAAGNVACKLLAVEQVSNYNGSRRPVTILNGLIPTTKAPVAMIPSSGFYEFSLSKGKEPQKIQTADPRDSIVAPIEAPGAKLAKSDVPPSISAPPSLSTADQSVVVSGKVVGVGRITSLTVDGSEAAVAPDGAFSFRRQVMIGDSELRLAAVDEWGRKAEATVKVTRTAAVSKSDTAYEPLHPDKVRGKLRPDALALIIGIERYESVPPAEFAERDARAFYDYAVNSLGIAPSRIKLLTDDKARRIDIDKALLTWLKPQVVKGKTDVFIFYSGHGLASDDGRDLYLLPSDGDGALLNRSALRRKEVIDVIVEAGARSATLFLDTCYSGGTRGKETLVASARPVVLVGKNEGVPPNVSILAAAANDQLSSSLPAVRHGLFSYFLMKGLEGAAAEGKTITVGGLESFIAGKVSVEAAKQGRTQTPQLVGDGSKVIATW